MLLDVAAKHPDAFTAEELVSELQANTQYAASLIDALLALASLESSDEACTEVSVTEIVAESIETFSRHASGLPSITFEHDGEARMVADPRLVRTRIDHVLSNALTHNVPGGWVSVAVHGDEDEIRCVVSNTGPRIAPEQLERLTEPLYRVRGGQSLLSGADETGNHTPSLGGHGHGLGLSLVRAIAAEQGAQLQFDAREEGGLTVTISWSHRNQPSHAGAVDTATSPELT